MSTAVAKIQEPKGNDLAKKTVCIKILMHKFGETRKANNAHVSVEGSEGNSKPASPDKEMVYVSKRLFDSPEMREIRRFDFETRNLLFNPAFGLCLPFEIGIHLLPIAKIQQTEDLLKQRAEEREALVKKFLKAYPELVKNASKRLRGLYNATDYPPVKEVAKEFSFYWQYVSFDVPGKLKELSSEMWNQEREKAAKRMAEAAENIQLVLRESMLQLVKKMSDRLKSDPDVKPLVFRNTLVANLTEFLGNFDFRNVTDDAQLQAVVKQARSLLDGVDADALRNTDTLREKVQKEMGKMAKSLEKMTTRGNRKFRLEE